MKYKALFDPQNNTKEFVNAEKQLYKNQLTFFNKKANTKTTDIFFLNNFLRNVRYAQPMSSIMEKIYGVGVKRSTDLMSKFRFGNFQHITYQNLTKYHIKVLSILLEDSNFILRYWLKNLRKSNIARVKFINCYRGIRHSLYLPVRGQRTHSNAHVARFLGSGTFEYVPQRPSMKLKKLSKYSRRKSFLVERSQIRYHRLLNKNYVEFSKTNKRLMKQLAKKNKLGVFGKLFKEKAKLAKDKAKKAKKSKQK